MSATEQGRGRPVWVLSQVLSRAFLEPTISIGVLLLCRQRDPRCFPGSGAQLGSVGLGCTHLSLHRLPCPAHSLRCETHEPGPVADADGGRAGLSGPPPVQTEGAPSLEKWGSSAPVTRPALGRQICCARSPRGVPFIAEGRRGTRGTWRDTRDVEGREGRPGTAGAGSRPHLVRPETPAAS